MGNSKYVVIIKIRTIVLTLLLLFPLLYATTLQMFTIVASFDRGIVEVFKILRGSFGNYSFSYEQIYVFVFGFARKRCKLSSGEYCRSTIIDLSRQFSCQIPNSSVICVLVKSFVGFFWGLAKLYIFVNFRLS